MFYKNNKAEDVKIAYIGGGSRGWAWRLMADLALETAMCGTVRLYDIEEKAALDNEKIGNGICAVHPDATPWKYEAVPTLEKALDGADFVVISILPGTFDEMESDVHTPEKYGIYQAVGDTIGPGGIVRTLRTLPMYRAIAEAIRDNCPDAWVINYTNPMSACTKALFEIFPEIKAFGCCHEVFTIQRVMQEYLKNKLGTEDIERSEIKIDVIGVNHFTWVTKIRYRNIDLMPVYAEFAKMGEKEEISKMHADLFGRYGMIPAAANSHISEFLPGEWYLGKDEKNREKWDVYRKAVSWRKEDLKDRLAKSERLISGEEKFEMKPSGEEGVRQMKALLGLEDIVTNVNLPNIGQISNLPLGAVVETNAHFTADKVTPLVAGEIPASILPHVAKAASTQLITVQAALTGNYEDAFAAFMQDNLITIGIEEGKKLFDEMLENVKEYLPGYKK